MSIGTKMEAIVCFKNVGVLQQAHTQNGEQASVQPLLFV
jgi:hypothetical protein